MHRNTQSDAKTIRAHELAVLGSWLRTGRICFVSRAQDWSLYPRARGRRFPLPRRDTFSQVAEPRAQPRHREIKKGATMEAIGRVHAADRPRRRLKIMYAEAVLGRHHVVAISSGAGINLLKHEPSKRTSTDLLDHLGGAKND